MAGKYRYGIFITMHFDNSKYTDKESLQVNTDKFYIIISEDNEIDYMYKATNYDEKNDIDNHSIYNLDLHNKMKYLKNSQVTSLNQAKELLSIIKNSFTPLYKLGVNIVKLWDKQSEKSLQYKRTIWPLYLMVSRIVFDESFTNIDKVDLNFDFKILRLDVNTNTVVIV